VEPGPRVFWVDGSFAAEADRARDEVQQLAGDVLAVCEELLAFAEELLSPPWSGRRPEGLRDMLVLSIAGACDQDLPSCT
jgi:hypothetical protein